MTLREIILLLFTFDILRAAALFFIRPSLDIRPDRRCRLKTRLIELNPKKWFADKQPRFVSRLEL